MSTRSIAEAIGLAAVLAGLVFVGMELRQNNRIARAAAFQEIGALTAEAWFDISQDSIRSLTRFELLSRPDSSSYLNLSPGVRAQEFADMVGQMRLYETVYLQFELGLLDERQMGRLGWRGVRDLPLVRLLWPHLGNYLDPSFRLYVTENWPDVPELVPSPAGMAP